MKFFPRLACLAALLLAACSILPKAESPTVYALPAVRLATPAGGAPVAWSLRVETPQAAHAIDSDRLAVMPVGDQITSYAGSRWSDRVPVLLRDRLIDAFQGDGRIEALTSDDSGLPADYVLGGDLRAFQIDYVDGRPVAVVRYDARLVLGSSQRIVAARRFEIRQPVAGKEVPQVVAALGQAGDALAAQLIPWTIREAGSARSSER